MSDAVGAVGAEEGGQGEQALDVAKEGGEAEGGEQGQEGGGVVGAEGGDGEGGAAIDPLQLVEPVYKRNRYLPEPAPSHCKKKWQAPEKQAFVNYIESTRSCWGKNFNPNKRAAYENAEDKTKSKPIVGVDPKRSPQCLLLYFQRLYKAGTFTFEI